MLKRDSISLYVEVFLHICYWTFHFSSVNTSWHLSWVDREAREGIAQLTIVLYPFIFYLNAFYLIPRLLKGNKWYQYLVISFLVLLALEVVRSIVFINLRHDKIGFEQAFLNEFSSQDNLLFGLPNSLVFAFLFSGIYRFTRDWIINQRIISSLQEEKIKMIGRLEELEDKYRKQSVEDSSKQDLQKDLESILMSKKQVYRNLFQGKRREETYLLKAADLAFFKAQGDFVLAYDENKQSYIINLSLSVLEEQLNPLQFFRINRSEIINLGFLIKYTNYVKNRLSISLRGCGDPLYTSNAKSADFRKWIMKVAN